VILALWACAAASAICWLLSLATRNYSQVDRLWSIAPPLYVAWFASRAHFADARLNLMLALTVAWGLRLTYNFARKGGYRWSGEDYRWSALRERLGPARFQLLNATFIAPIQNAILFALTLPAFEATRRPSPLGARDAIAAALFVAFLVGETIADQQQWRFHQEKLAGRAQGFLDRGLFARSRHPNFFCEIMIWWSFWLLQPTPHALAGPVALTLLFQGSTGFTEQLTLAKYPSYADYQRRVSRLIPWITMKG
jgi:steroid 5-alpha reductase family enzyme